MRQKTGVRGKASPVATWAYFDTMNSIPDLILNVVMAALVLNTLKAVRTYPLKRRLAAILGVLILFVILFNLPPLAKGLLSGVLVIVTLRKTTRTHEPKQAPQHSSEETIAPAPTRTAVTEKEDNVDDDEQTTITLGDLNDAFDADDITMSYAHPQTGVMHVDAALNVYTSHAEEAVKAQACRIIIAHMIKTAAFSTGHDDLDQALKEVITNRDPLALTTTLQSIPEQLAKATDQSETSEPIKHKVCTILDIVRVITENPDAQSQLQGVAEEIKQSD